MNKRGAVLTIALIAVVVAGAGIYSYVGPQLGPKSSQCVPTWFCLDENTKAYGSQVKGCSYKLVTDCIGVNEICENGGCIVPEEPSQNDSGGGSDGGGGNGGGNSSLLPDLDIISFTITIGNKTNSTYPVTLFATVKNIGLGNAGSSATGFEVSTFPPLLISTKSLLAGESTTVNSTYNVVSGTYNATATADWYNSINESNEGNNEAILFFSVA